MRVVHSHEQHSGQAYVSQSVLLRYIAVLVRTAVSINAAKLRSLRQQSALFYN